MSRIFLIRHAEPEAAWGGADDDPGLTERGRGQAAATADALMKVGPLEVLYSPMRRCRETAAPYEQRTGSQGRTEPRVSEIVAPASVTDRPAWLRRYFPWGDGQPRGKWDALDPLVWAWRDRAVEAMRELRNDAAVFTHFIAINVIAGAALGSDETIVCRPGHGSITELDVNDGVVRVVRLGAEMASDDVR